VWHADAKVSCCPLDDRGLAAQSVASRYRDRVRHEPHDAHPTRRSNDPKEATMAKGQNSKKTEKKKPEKTLKEKRAEKAAKKAMKG
jgi:hypothetical protein